MTVSNSKEGAAWFSFSSVNGAVMSKNESCRGKARKGWSVAFAAVRRKSKAFLPGEGDRTFGTVVPFLAVSEPFLTASSLVKNEKEFC